MAILTLVDEHVRLGASVFSKCDELMTVTVRFNYLPQRTALIVSCIKIAGGGDKETEETFEVIGPHAPIGSQKNIEIRCLRTARFLRKKTFYAIVVPNFVGDLGL
jgi:hypothetical protein